MWLFFVMMLIVATAFGALVMFYYIKDAPKYAVILEMTPSAIISPRKPYLIKTEESERVFRRKMDRLGRMIVIADKQTLLNNPFDLTEEDFENAVERW